MPQIVAKHSFQVLIVPPAPKPFMDASVCRVMELLGLKYGSVTFLEISSFVLEKATHTV